MTRGPLVLLLASVTACSARVQHGLDERQANELQTALLERGLSARKVLEDGRPPTWALEVDGAEAADAVRVLAELGLPRPRQAGLRELLKPGLVPDPLEQHALLLEAQSGEIARTLEAVDGVVSARVHVVRPQPVRGGAPLPAAKASVFLRVQQPAAERLEGMREGLRALVAGAVEGLEPGGVTLVLAPVAVTLHAASPARAPGSRALGLLGTGSLVLALASAAVAARQLRRRRHRALVPVRATPSVRPPAAKAAG